MLTDFFMLSRRFWEEVFWTLPVLWHILFEISDFYLAGIQLTLEDPGRHEIPLYLWY